MLNASVVLCRSRSTRRAYLLGATISGQLTIHDSPVDRWRLTSFGANANNAAIVGNLADPDGDGIVNLSEYALG